MMRDAILQLSIGFLQLLIQNHIVECHRQPAAEDLDQRTVGVGQILRGLKQHHDFAVAGGADVEHRAVVDEFMLAALER